MENYYTIIPEEFYTKYLTVIKKVEFTPREIDVISCLLNGKKEKKVIAQFLSDDLISLKDRGIETHIANISRKIQGNGIASIVNFVEKSDEYQIIRNHYLSLFLQKEFTSSLLKAKLLINSINSCLIISFQEDTKCSTLITKLKSNLKTIGINVLTELRQNLNCFSIQSISVEEYKYIILIIPKTEELSVHEISVLNNIASATRISSSQSSILFLVYDIENYRTILTNVFRYIDIKMYKNYYFLFFEILKTLFPIYDLETINTEFKEKYNNVSYDSVLSNIIKLCQNLIKNDSLKKIKNNDTYINNLLLCIIMLLLLTIMVFLALYGSHYIKKTKSDDTSLIRSELIIPPKNALLKRSEVFNKMEKNLQGKQGIQKIALIGIVGMGGAGKTTLARYYGLQQKDIEVVFEINVETKYTALNSFRNLAYLLANTSALKEKLNFIQQIQSPDIQEQQLLLFVKTCLQKKLSWLLIYDNMESFADINHFFPHDPKQWGNGKVIITTRNEHIKNTGYIKPENIIHIQELTDSEMLILFSKILYNCHPTDLKHCKEIIDFLKLIPPFPLDVSVAAYFIKNHNITLEEYISYINDCNMNYEVINGVTDYSKTRYVIISSAIEKLNKINTNFRELFLFVCCLDSQNIPYKLLQKYKNTLEVDNFIYNLRRNGLLLKEISSNLGRENTAISIHRSTQKIGTAFLFNSLFNKEKEDFIKSIISTISSFYEECVETHDIKTITMIIPHLRALLNMMKDSNYSEDFKNKFEIDLAMILGKIYYKYERNLLKARNFFKLALEKNNNSNYLSQQNTASLLNDLCNISALTFYPEDAVIYCNQSIEIAKALPDGVLTMADSLQALGSTYRKTNEFEKSKFYLTKSLDKIPKLRYEHTKELRADIYTQLGYLYLTHYAHKREAAQSLEYHIKSLEILGAYNLFHVKKFLPTSISCNAARQEWKYTLFLVFYSLDYDNAHKWLNEATYILEEKCPNDLYLKGRIAGTMGEILLRTNNPLEAENKLTQSINWIGMLLGEKASWFQNASRAEARIRIGKYKEGYKDSIFVISLNSREKNNLHDLAYLASLYHAAFAQYKLEENKKSLKHFTAFIQNAKNFCKNFLTREEYNSLAIYEAFKTMSYNKKTEIVDIKTYLHNSRKIFTSIYGANHPFVQDYITINTLEK